MSERENSESEIDGNLSADNDEEIEEEVIDGDEDIEREDGKKDSKLVKAVKKRQRAVKDTQDRAKQAVLRKLQVVLFIALVIVFMSWSKVEGMLHWLGGQQEITVELKTMKEDCPEILTSDGDLYCIEEDSFNMAEEGTNYMITKGQYAPRLREVKKYGL